MSIKEAKKLAKIYPMIVRVPASQMRLNRDVTLRFLNDAAGQMREQIGSKYRLFMVTDDLATEIEFVTYFHGRAYHKLLKQFSASLRQDVGKHP